jgi:hypothetical protein
MKIALIQQTATDNIKVNRQRGLDAVRSAARSGAQRLFLGDGRPELYATWHV